MLHMSYKTIYHWRKKI